MSLTECQSRKGPRCSNTHLAWWHALCLPGWLKRIGTISMWSECRPYNLPITSSLATAVVSICHQSLSQQGLQTIGPMTGFSIKSSDGCSTWLSGLPHAERLPMQWLKSWKAQLAGPTTLHGIPPTLLSACACGIPTAQGHASAGTWLQHRHGHHAQVGSNRLLFREARWQSKIGTQSGPCGNPCQLTA